MEGESRLGFMTEEEIKNVDNWLTKIEYNRGQLGSYYTRWEVEQTAYSGDQEIKENRPNSRVNIVNANIEGQVASLIEQNIATVVRGEGPSDQSFAKWGRILLDWSLRKNHIKRLIERHERRRELFGPAWFKLYWDADAINGFGLATVTCPSLNSIFVDLKINDPLNIQDAEYIAEVMLKSKSWAENQERYKDKAKNIKYGGTDRASIFQKEKTSDDDDAFWLIQLWTKTNDMLRLLEFSDDGVLLYDSFEDEDIGKKPYYRYNKYPYFLTNLYHEEGKLLGFGDGKLLRPLQEMINDLYDQIRRAARPNRIFFDPDSNVELEELDQDDGPIPCDRPNETIRVVEVGTVNPALWNLLANIHQEIQRVIRFSELMTGQSMQTKTATEASIQQQQGSTGTDHKKMMLQETLNDLCTYMLDMMMEHYDEGKAFRIDEDKDDYEWIDPRQLNSVPHLIPADSAYLDSFRKENPSAESPQWMQLTDEQNKGVTKSVDFDIEISIGAGLPKNKAFLYQMLEKFGQMVVEGRNVLSWQEFRDFAKDFLGLPLEDQPEITQGQPQMPQGIADLLQSPMAEGLSAGGNPQMGALPPQQGMTGGGMVG